MKPIPVRRLGVHVFLLLWTVCLAVATSKINSSNIQLSNRGISKDPSCPNDWLCQQSSCNATCPEGEICIEFEGTAVCAPAGQTWCALNPKTLQAVECQNGGVCCHGNCYKAGTVCCDNGSVQCSIGDSCLACPGGNTCTTGASTCASGGGSQSTTPVASTTPVPPKTTSSTPTQQPATSTSRAPITPTLVQQDGTYKYIGCYVDGANSRSLVVGNSTDASSDGMTVEKCVALAKKKNLRYAGVEFGSECFMGNTLHSNTKVSDGDCNKVCAGAPTEYCGQSNRVQVYEDTTWSDPTLDELTNVLVQYNSTLFKLRTLTGQYNDLIQQWADQEKANGRQKKRWLSRRGRIMTVTELHDGLSEVERQYPQVRAILAQAAQNGGVLYLRAANSDVVRPGQTNPFVDGPTLENARQAFDIPLQPLGDVQNAIEDDLRSIAESTSSTTPLLNTARDLQVAGNANKAIGTISGATLGAIAAGNGVFALLAYVFLHLHPETSSGNPSTTLHSQPTSVIVTSTTSSSATAAATPYLLVAADGVSVNDFQTFTDKLANTPKEPVINSPFAIARVVSLNDTEYEQVQKNKIVFSVTPNENQGIQMYVHNPDLNFTLEASPGLGLEKRTAKARGTAKPGTTIPATKLTGRDGIFGLHIGHLTSLSQKWFTEKFTDGFDFVYETNPGAGTFIYVIDNGVDFTHPEFQRVQKEQLLVTDYKPEKTHGTAVAGQALGKVMGVASSATLIDVPFKLGDEDNMMKTLTAVYDDIVAKGRGGKAVVNMSWGLHSKGRLSQNYWLAKAMKKFIDIGAVPVCAAGNMGALPGAAGTYDESVPGFYISGMEGLIVVGSVDENGKRAADCGKCDAQNSISVCLSAYAMGSGVMVADSKTGDYTPGWSGTSLAAPIISGLIAYLMAHPNADIQSQVYDGGNAKVADNVDFIINNWSWSRNPTGGVDYPNVAWNGVIADACKLNAGPGGQIPATPDVPGTNPTSQTNESPVSGVTNSCPVKK